MTKWIEGYSVLITGGASGLGCALVRRFIDEGANVAVLDRSPEKLDELRAEFGATITAVLGDVRDHEANAKAVRETVNAYGRLDVLIGNAGIWDWNVPLVDLPDDSFDEVFREIFEVNVKAYILGAKVALPELVRTRGSIIFTLSNAAFYPGGGGVLYTASKHAVVGVIRQLAHEFAPLVRVNGVAPGAIDTDLRGPHALGLQDRSLRTLPLAELVKRYLPLGWLPKAEEYTGHYVLLASRENSGTMTGEIIECDGGMSARGIAEPAKGNELRARYPDR